jgi:uncharacterized membrane protein YccC
VVAIGSALQMPILAWAAIGAFWTCLADPGGPNPDRLRALAGFTLLSTAFAIIGAAAASQGWGWAAAAVVPCALVGAMAGAYGAAARQIGALATVVCVTAIDHPVASPAALAEFAATHFAGCLWAMLLALSIWRIHPFRPARSALATTYRGLAAMAAGLARLDARSPPLDWARHAQRYRPAVRAAIETARATLGRAMRGRDGLGDYAERLLMALDIAERIFGQLIALSDLRQHAGPAADRHRAQERQALRRLALTLFRRARSFDTGHGEMDAPQRSLDRLALLAGQMEGPVAAGLGRIVEEIRATGSARPALAQTEAATASRDIKTWLAPLRAHLSLRSEILRHALRCAVATTAAVLLSHALGFSYAYWMAIATVLVLQSSVAATWPRALERTVGSVLGGGLAALLGLVLHTPLALTAAVFPLAIATMAMRQVNYGIFVFFLTPLFIVVVELSQPGASEPALAGMRALYNVLGSAIGLAGGLLLWPSREGRQFRPLLAAAIEANGRYAALAFAHDGDEAAIEAARREAGLASGNAEAGHGRTMLEAWWQHETLDAGLTILVLARQIAGVAGTAWLHRPAGTVQAEDAAFGRWLGTETAALADALRTGAALPAPTTPPAAPDDPERSRAEQEVLLLRAATERLVPA